MGSARRPTGTGLAAQKYQEKQRERAVDTLKQFHADKPRVEYLLTERGLALIDILKAIQEFGVHCLSDIPDLSLKPDQE